MVWAGEMMKKKKKSPTDRRQIHHWFIDCTLFSVFIIQIQIGDWIQSQRHQRRKENKYFRANKLKKFPFEVWCVRIVMRMFLVADTIRWSREVYRFSLNRYICTVWTRRVSQVLMEGGRSLELDQVNPLFRLKNGTNQKIHSDIVYFASTQAISHSVTLSHWMESNSNSNNLFNVCW